MFSWAPLLVMGPGTVYRMYSPLDGAGVGSINPFMHKVAKMVT